MNNFVLGRYLPYDSIIHRFDPRAKIWAMILLVVGIFIPLDFWGYLIIGSLVVMAMGLSKVPIKAYIQGFKPLIFMMGFLLVLNILMIKTGYLIFAWGWFSIYSGAVYQTVFIFTRLVLMISITTILTVTTKPLDLTLGIEELLKPFKRFGMPTHEISMMISIALRFIPTILEEAMRILKAQQSRGVDLKQGKLSEKLKAILALIIPLFVCAFLRAEELANAMEARGYNPQGKRSRFHILYFKYYDGVLVFSCVMLVCILIGIRVWL